MQKNNSRGILEYFKTIFHSVIGGGMQSIYNHYQTSGHDLVNYIKDQSIHDDAYYKVFYDLEEIRSQNYSIKDFLTNSLTYGMTSIATKISYKLLSDFPILQYAIGGICSMKIKDYLGIQPTISDFLFGVIASLDRTIIENELSEENNEINSVLDVINHHISSNSITYSE